MQQPAGVPPDPDRLPDRILSELRAAVLGAAPLPRLEPDTYARDHAAFEAHSDQRRLIADHLRHRLAQRASGPVAVLSVGCGDGSLDAPLAAGLVDADPGRAVRYVGVEPYAGSAARFAEAMTSLGRPSLDSRVHVSTFADAPLTGTFDVITFVHSMYYVPDVAATLRAAHALLEPGGELVVLSAQRGELNALVEVLAPRIDGHRQWFSDAIATGLRQAGLSPDPALTLQGLLDLGTATDEVLDFTVQARLTPELRPLVRAYLDAVSVPDRGGRRVPHPVDVHAVTRPGPATPVDPGRLIVQPVLGPA